MSWKGNIENPSPNNAQETIDRSEKFISDERAMHIRRDTDSQKDPSITLYDIDKTILQHLEQLQLQIIDTGNKIKVPIFYGSPELWTSAQRDGYMRDKQGKIILPAIILKRTSSETDASLKFFNRYLNTPVMKLYSSKNKYTAFSLLSGTNVPVNEVYNIIVPSHMILKYHFIIWTEYVEQMNTLVENIQFNTRDYWGTEHGLRFRTEVDGYSHTVELQANEDRVVKTEFDLTTHGYILPDTITKLDKRHYTTNKAFTKKKMIIGVETSEHTFAENQNREKWRNPSYPNLQADVPIPTPVPSTITGNDDINAISSQIVNTLTTVTQTPIVDPVSVGLDNTRPFLRVVPPPVTMAAGGEEGYVSYDKNYFYIFTSGQWRRVAISQFSTTPPSQEGNVSFNNQYFYLYSSGSWRQVAISKFS
jgi:hypothetical protein